MRTSLIAYYHRAAQTAISLLLVIIILSIPSASFSDISYYKTLFTGGFKNIFNNHYPEK